MLKAPATYSQSSPKSSEFQTENAQDGIFSLDACRCIGACGLAPVMTVNDDVYGKLTVDEIDGILAKYTE